MSYCRIEAATVTVEDYRALREWWRTTDPLILSYVGAVIVTRGLSDAQRGRLPVDLRRKVKAPNDSVAFLEGLWCLEDNRPTNPARF